MARGGARVGAGRPKKARTEPVAKTAKTATVASADPDRFDGVADEFRHGSQTPLAYMLEVMNDSAIDGGRRDRMAVAAAPYLHPKLGEAGKKENQKGAAKTAGAGRFAPAAAPLKLVG